MSPSLSFQINWIDIYCCFDILWFLFIYWCLGTSFNRFYIIFWECLHLPQIKEKREICGLLYSPSSCRSSGNICWYCSRNLRNGVLIYGLLIDFTEIQSLWPPCSSSAITPAVPVRSSQSILASTPESKNSVHWSIIPSFSQSTLYLIWSPSGSVAETMSSSVFLSYLQVGLFGLLFSNDDILRSIYVLQNIFPF